MDSSIQPLIDLAVTDRELQIFIHSKSQLEKQIDTASSVVNQHKKTIEVNPENFETNKKGIFAIGDICNYPGKLKLILSGFHEGALAARGCFKYARPNEKYRFEFTTTSKTVKSRIGVKE